METIAVKPCRNLDQEIQRQIYILGTSNVSMALFSITASHIPASNLLELVRIAADRLEFVGFLPDGTVGVLSLQPFSGQGKAWRDLRFLPTLKEMLGGAGSRANLESVYVRMVERNVAELHDDSDLIDALGDLPVVSLRNWHPDTVTDWVAEAPVPRHFMHRGSLGHFDRRKIHALG